MSIVHMVHMPHVKDMPSITFDVFGGPKKQNPANAGFCDVTKF
jgi:hypothetical protein